MKNRHIAKKNARFAARNRHRVRGGERNVFISFNFSDIEDSAAAFEIIRDLAAKAGKNAAAEARAARLSRIFIRNNKLIRVMADGTETVVKTKPSGARAFYVKYKPSTILHAVNK